MYFDVSTQYTFDENILTSDKQDIDHDKNENNYDSQSRGSEGFQVEGNKEGTCDETVGKFPQAYVGGGRRRSSEVSVFNDMDCGEPATGQHLRINFAFTEDDNIELEEKCRSFWKFIKNHPHLEQMKIMPINDTQSSSAEGVTGLKKNLSDIMSGKTAMQWVQHGDVVKSAMSTKLNTAYCNVVHGDYCDGRKTRSRDVVKIRADGRKGVGGKLSSGSSRVLSADEVNTISQGMDEWDAAHPRSMDPPKIINSSF